MTARSSALDVAAGASPASIWPADELSHRTPRW